MLACMFNVGMLILTFSMVISNATYCARWPAQSDIVNIVLPEGNTFGTLVIYIYHFLELKMVQVSKLGNLLNAILHKYGFRVCSASNVTLRKTVQYIIDRSVSICSI